MKTFGQIMVVIIVLIAIVLLSFTCRSCDIFMNHATNSMENAVVSYDEYQDIKATCDKLNTDLGNLESLPDSDKMFEQFSKAQRINTTKTNLNRWVEDYNAKSKHIDKRWWKSSELPYSLDVNQFSNYNK